ncbi:MAG: hypothetical protein RRB13_16615 [bacterium]|nr:hypothetical protein [bacterium]
MNVFKKIGLSLSALILAASPLMAAERMIMGGLGSASGSYDYQDSDAQFSFLNSKLDHDMSGSSLSVAYVGVEDSGLMWGAGYHSYTLTGDSGTQTWNNLTVDGTTYDQYTANSTTDLTLTGFYGLVGYQLKFADKFKFMPNLRLGIGNTSEVKLSVYETVTLGGTKYVASGASTDSGSASPLFISLPLYFQVSEKLGLGLELISGGLVHEITSGTSTYTYRLAGATQLSLTYGF